VEHLGAGSRTEGIQELPDSALEFRRHQYLAQDLLLQHRHQVFHLEVCKIWSAACDNVLVATGPEGVTDPLSGHIRGLEVRRWKEPQRGTPQTSMR
jgi:hypothetical protein